MRQFLILLLALVAGHSAFARARSSRPAAPLPFGSIGHYANGCLNSEARLTGAEVGMHKLFVERDRYYANPALLELLNTLGREYAQTWPAPNERVQVGDVAQKHGGLVSHHASHQTGLDVDLVYMRKDFRETKPDRGFEAGFDEEFVQRGTVTANFDGARTWWLLRWLQRSGRIDRVFVDKEIKRYFCKQSEAYEPTDHVARVETLRLLRPWKNHADHFHVRLLCPTLDPKCLGSPPLKPGSGCDGPALEEEEEVDGPSDAPMESLVPPAQSTMGPQRPAECVSLGRKRG